MAAKTCLAFLIVMVQHLLVGINRAADTGLVEEGCEELAGIRPNHYYMVVAATSTHLDYNPGCTHCFIGSFVDRSPFLFF